jgi:Trypsin
MPYTLELYFTGMCLFVPDEEGSTCTVVLVAAGDPDTAFSDLAQGDRPSKHRPYLTFPIENRAVATTEPAELVPDSLGSTLLRYNLEGADLQLSAGEGQLSLEAPVDGFPALSFPNAMNEAAFEWVVGIDSATGPERCKIKDSVLANVMPTDLVTTRLTINSGRLGTSRVSVDNSGFPLMFRFSEPNTVPSPAAEARALADFVVLRVENLDSEVLFKFRTGNSFRAIALKATKNGEIIRASLTNFDIDPTAVDCNNTEPVRDFLWYRQLLDDPTAFRIPWPEVVTSIEHTPSCSCCPPCRTCPPSTRSASSEELQTLAVSTHTAGLDELRSLWKDNGGTDELFDSVASSDFLLHRFELLLLGGALVSKDRPYPECVAIGDSQYWGSGIVVHPRAVLTASHGVGRKQPKDLRVGVQSSPLGVFTTYEVASVEYPDGYPREHHCSDLALLILKDSNLPNLPPPIPFPGVTQLGRATVVGYGENPVNKLNFGLKHEGEIDIINVAYQRPIGTFSCPNFEMLGKKVKANPCIGDSGGPLYFEPTGYPSRELVGIVSRPTNPRARCAGETVFTRVDGYMTWIDRVLKAL